MGGNSLYIEAACVERAEGKAALNTTGALPMSQGSASGTCRTVLALSRPFDCTPCIYSSCCASTPVMTAWTSSFAPALCHDVSFDTPVLAGSDRVCSVTSCRPAGRCDEGERKDCAHIRAALPGGARAGQPLLCRGGAARARPCRRDAQGRAQRGVHDHHCAALARAGPPRAA